MLLGFSRRYLTGILPRYVVGQVIKSFVLALLTMTAVFVLIMVMAEASRAGLTPRDLLQLIPYIIPSTLPYTVPVALLFAVSVVYGRLASDNEVIAVKTAGLSVLTVLMPSLVLGMALSVLLFFLSGGPIPWATHMVKSVLFSNLEDGFYKFLKKDGQFDNPRWPFFISVQDVQGKVLIRPVFMHRSGKGENPNTVDLWVSAKSATIRFDRKAGMARVYLVDGEVQGTGNQPIKALVTREPLEIPFEKEIKASKRVQEMTAPEIVANQAEVRHKIANERRRQAIAAALFIASGNIGRVDWPHIREAYRDYQRWEREDNELESEKQMRIAMAFGSFFFAILGAPVGILFARRDFLSAFMSCFLPIILIYYPLTLLGLNLGKEGKFNPMAALWMGNAVLAVLAGFVALPPVFKH